jgi:hypothetical protein
MNATDAESHGKEVLRRLGEKIRRELLDPSLNVRNLLSQVEQSSHLARLMIEDTRKESHG